VLHCSASFWAELLLLFGKSRLAKWHHWEWNTQYHSSSIQSRPSEVGGSNGSQAADCVKRAAAAGAKKCCCKHFNKLDDLMDHSCCCIGEACQKASRTSALAPTAATAWCCCDSCAGTDSDCDANNELLLASDALLNGNTSDTLKASTSEGLHWSQQSHTSEVCCLPSCCPADTRAQTSWIFRKVLPALHPLPTQDSQNRLCVHAYNLRH